jgi:hypothetical protein
MPATASSTRRGAPATRAIPTRARPRSPLRVVPKLKEPRVTAARDDLARQYAQCRSLGHTWHHIGWADPTLRRPLGDYNVLAFVSRCEHCQTERTKWVSPQGHRGTTSYAYPDGYSRHGDEALTRDEWRRTWVVTLLGDRA